MAETTHRYVVKDASGNPVAFYDDRVFHKPTLKDGSPNPAANIVPSSMMLPANAVPIDDAEYEALISDQSKTVKSI